jgi:hypothetical protein
MLEPLSTPGDASAEPSQGNEPKPKRVSNVLPPLLGSFSNSASSFFSVLQPSQSKPALSSKACQPSLYASGRVNGAEAR